MANLKSAKGKPAAVPTNVVLAASCSCCASCQNMHRRSIVENPVATKASSVARSLKLSNVDLG